MQLPSESEPVVSSPVEDASPAEPVTETVAPVEPHDEAPAPSELIKLPGADPDDEPAEPAQDEAPAEPAILGAAHPAPEYSRVHNPVFLYAPGYPLKIVVGDDEFLCPNALLFGPALL